MIIYYQSTIYKQMTILWGFKRLMLSHTGFSRLEMSLAEALVCKPELVRNVWQELQLDSYEAVLTLI